MLSFGRRMQQRTAKCANQQRPTSCRPAVILRANRIPAILADQKLRAVIAATELGGFDPWPLGLPSNPDGPVV